MIVDWLENEKKQEKVFLWGRSMGAVTALHYISISPNPIIKACILDSPFADLRNIVNSLVGSSPIPKFLISAMFSMIGLQVKQFTGLDIDKFKPGEFCKEGKTKVLILHGRQDELVGVENSEIIYENYGGEK